MNNFNKKPKATILVVDDEALPRQAISEILDQGGFHVVTANNGHEALDIFAEGTFDLVTTCIIMPVMDGLTFLENLKWVSPQTPVIIITALASIELVREAKQMGVSGYIIKPVDREELISKIEDVLKVVNL